MRFPTSLPLCGNILIVDELQPCLPLHEYLQHYNIPVCYDFPVGHHSGFNPPMVEGCQVLLKVEEQQTRLQFMNNQNVTATW